VRERGALALLTLVTGLLAILPPRPAAGPVRLALMGDLMLGRGVARAHGDGDWERTAEALEPALYGVDLALGNLESPLTTAALTRPALDLRAHPNSAEALARLGFDILTLANNHSLDAGSIGLRDTTHALRSAGIEAVGPSPEAWEGTVGGLSTALIALDDTLQDLDLRAAHDLVALLHGRADLVLVSVHWGVELEPAANSRQRFIATALASAGADIVFGHGPHVLQEVEWIWGDGRGRPSLVAFSLGNALFDSPAPPSARRSAALIVEVDRGTAFLACVVPLGIDPRTWDLVPAGPASAGAILRSLQAGQGRVGPLIAACP